MTDDLARLHAMLRIRRFEEKAAELYTQGKIRGFLHLCIGEEAVCVGALRALASQDNVVSTYREHGHALARDIPMPSLMAELFGKATGCCRGRGGSMHFFDVARRFYGGNAIVGGGLPLAVGLALADRMQHRTAVTMCLFGDGAVAEGEFHESMNLAALWHLPVLFVCENNLYAMGTALTRHQAQPDIARKADGYGVVAETVDGMDVRAVERTMTSHVAAIRGGGGPRLVEARTYRFRAHSMYDPELYRTKAEVEQWKVRDPIPALTDQLRHAGDIDDTALAALESEIDAELAAAVAAADAAPWEPVDDLLRDVYTADAAMGPEETTPCA
jgi:pyruvate dehydrogenase E1 component alpha subunit